MDPQKSWPFRPFSYSQENEMRRAQSYRLPLAYTHQWELSAQETII